MAEAAFWMAASLTTGTLSSLLMQRLTKVSGHPTAQVTAKNLVHHMLIYRCFSNWREDVQADLPSLDMFVVYIVNTCNGAEACQRDVHCHQNRLLDVTNPFLES
eukprot:9274560-Pyramimonas_sp.AAC.1